MKGPAQRLILKAGTEYNVLNSDGGGGRDTSSYSKTGTIIGILESRGMPRTVTDSDGTEVNADREIRAVVHDVALREAGSANGYPTKLEHPDGTVYRVLDTLTEDTGVTVITVVRD